MKVKVIFISVLLLVTSSLYAATPETTPAAQAVSTPVQPEAPKEPTVFERRIKGEAGQLYKKLFSALENNGYFVVFETNIGKNLSRFAKRWGDDYNKNKLESIRSMIFCNGWYANQVSNHDPKMLALCPMHITITYKKGITSILYVRPSQVAADSPAKKIATELEQDVVRIINSIS